MCNELVVLFRKHLSNHFTLVHERPKDQRYEVFFVFKKTIIYVHSHKVNLCSFAIIKKIAFTSHE